MRARASVSGVCRHRTVATESRAARGSRRKLETAGIGALPGTLADRSIRAELQRKKPDEHVTGFRSDRIDHLRILARQMVRWLDDNEEVLRSAEPAMPPSMHNRKADNWRPLLSIADAAGGDWPECARTAAIALSTNALAERQMSRSSISDVRPAYWMVSGHSGSEAEIAFAMKL